MGSTDPDADVIGAAIFAAAKDKVAQDVGVDVALGIGDALGRKLAVTEDATLTLLTSFDQLFLRRCEGERV